MRNIANRLGLVIQMSPMTGEVTIKMKRSWAQFFLMSAAMHMRHVLASGILNEGQEKTVKDRIKHIEDIREMFSHDL